MSSAKLSRIRASDAADVAAIPEQANCLQCKYYAVMATIHVRDVSEDAVITLKVRAARAGQSLQAYVRQLLEREAATVTPEEAAERARAIAERSSVTADDVVDAIASMREARA
jgi:plasmid stability protein